MPLLGWAPPDSSSSLIRERNTIIHTIRETSCFLGPLVLGPWARQSAPRFSSRVSGGEILSHVAKAGRREQSLPMGPPSPSDRSYRLLGGYRKTNTNLFSFPKNTEVRILNNKVQRMEVAIDRNRQLGRETKQVIAKNDTFLKRNKQIKKTIILGMIPK